jgi:hypothetical protein
MIADKQNKALVDCLKSVVEHLHTTVRLRSMSRDEWGIVADANTAIAEAANIWYDPETGTWYDYEG